MVHVRRLGQLLRLKKDLNDIHVTVLPWTASSPDLTPIEQVWGMIGRRPGQLFRSLIQVTVLTWVARSHYVY